jgi:phosphatidate cytidylyltransferase
MELTADRQLLVVVLGGVAVLLLAATVTGAALRHRARGEDARRLVDNLKARIRAWWVMVGVVGVALLSGPLGSVLLFGVVSFLALREFITLTPTRRGDHRTLFWAFFVFVPAQYYLVAIQWYGLFVIFIPVYAFLFVPLRSVLAGDTQDFLARTATIQWGLMLAVYCVSHAPALQMLQIPGYGGRGPLLLLYLILVVQLSDVLQYVFGKTLGHRRIAPRVSPSKTWEGTVGGIAGATLVGAGLWWLTPFSPLAAAAIATAVCLAGFAGGLCMSAIKRDRGVKDFGSLIEVHGGIMDRIDSLCFAAPLFFHLVRFYYT